MSDQFDRVLLLVATGVYEKENVRVYTVCILIFLINTSTDKREKKSDRIDPK